MPVCPEALLFFCSYVLMFFRVSGKSHSFTHNYMPVCVMPRDASPPLVLAFLS